MAGDVLHLTPREAWPNGLRAIVPLLGVVGLARLGDGARTDQQGSALSREVQLSAVFL